MGSIPIVSTTFPQVAGLLAPLTQVSLRENPATRVEEVTEALTRIRGRALPYREQRKAFVAMLANRHGLETGEISKAADRGLACAHHQPGPEEGPRTPTGQLGRRVGIKRT